MSSTDNDREAAWTGTTRRVFGLLLFLLASAYTTRAQSGATHDPHMNSTLLPRLCAGCHEGHGASRSPMLPSSQSEVCLACHDTTSRLAAMVAQDLIDANVQPPLLSSALGQPFTHPLDPAAFSRRQPGVVVCTSCHSPHRDSRAAATTEAGRRPSPRDPDQFEFELCQECHGSEGATTRSLADTSRLFDPNNRSFHPVQSPALTESASVIEELRGREINCTDCHGNDDPRGARGPHGSSVRFLLKERYVSTDGSEENGRVYALCYSCHRRRDILDETSAFPLHELHVVQDRASCATCHSAHGSIENRALIRFGEETRIGAVAPSMRTGELAFVSDMPGSGTCFLTCHGVDHDPFSYGESATMSSPSPFLIPRQGSASSGENLLPRRRRESEEPRAARPPP